MDASNDTSSRRLFDARHDYLQRRGSLADEAERAIILRLVDGVPQNYMVLMGTGWRGSISSQERKEPTLKLWYEAVEAMVKNENFMNQRKFLADFYRETWKSLSEVERKGLSRTEWITLHLSKQSHEDAELADLGVQDSFPVSQELRPQYYEFERRYAKEHPFRKAAQQTHFEHTQPEAAERLRKEDAEKVALTAVDWAIIEDLAANGKGKTPFFWNWEDDFDEDIEGYGMTDVEESTGSTTPRQHYW